MVPRYYQTECKVAIFDYLARYTGNPIAAMPTGTGKSVVIADVLLTGFKEWPALRVMILTHVKELIAQNFKELMELWPMAPAGIFSAGLGRREVRPITFAGIGSVVGKGVLFGHVDIVLIDECHLLSPKEDTEYQTFIAELRTINPKVSVVGLTATPYRLGQGMLTDPTEQDGKPKPPLFTDICYDITGREAFTRLIAEGYLCNLIPRRTGTQIDVSEVHIRGGEFVANELQAAVDKDEITYAAIQEMIELGAERKHWLVFATGVKHCEHVAAMLQSMGIPAHALHSKNDKNRDKFIDDFQRGKVRALVNNNILTTGFNFKPIDLIGVLRPTSSPGLWVQMLGRGTRPYDYRTERNRELAALCPYVKTDCLVLDFAGNTKRLGPINDPVIPKRKGKKQGGEAPVKLCEACNTYNHARAIVCIKCKADFPPEALKIQRNASTEQLIVGSQPLVEIFPVTSMQFRKHRQSPDKPPSLKVEYFCGPVRSFTDWVCLEHIGFASKKARDWWRTAADDFDAEPPATIDEALTKIETLQRPTHVKVWVNCAYPRIMGYDYSGTAWGTLAPKNEIIPCVV